MPLHNFGLVRVLTPRELVVTIKSAWEMMAVCLYFQTPYGCECGLSTTWLFGGIGRNNLFLQAKITEGPIVILEWIRSNWVQSSVLNRSGTLKSSQFHPSCIRLARAKVKLCRYISRATTKLEWQTHRLSKNACVTFSVGDF
jgi:hypothetical protein